MINILTIADKYPTDKISHGFLDVYQDHLAAHRYDVKKILEIGLFNGNSARLWREYFPNAEIYVLDNLELPQSKRAYQELSETINIKVADQANRSDLKDAINLFGSDFDIIIDDGGHLMDQQQISLGFLFPHLKPGGWYIVEDLHTSFMPNSGINAEGTNNTYKLLKDFQQTRDFKSPHLSHKEISYLKTSIKQVDLYHPHGDNDHITSIITKKSLVNCKTPINIVYYAYLNPGTWQAIVKGQLISLRASNLADFAKIKVVLCGNDLDTQEATEMVRNIIIGAEIIETRINRYEFPGLHTLWRWAQEEPDNIYLYFHSKGAVRGNGLRLIEEKKLFSQTIMAWKHIRNIFTDTKINKIGFAASPSGFFWYNFWWARGSYLNRCSEPQISDNRHDFESWLRLYDGDATSAIDCYSLASEKLGVSYMPTEADQALYNDIDKFKDITLL